MNLQNLRIFFKVASLEHVTHAAEELHLSQPAVTKAIHSLEQEVHLDLVERQGRRIALTQAGRVLRDYAQRLFGLEREMEEALSALRDVEGGEITFAANTTAWVYLLPPIVARFRAYYPRVALHVSILNSHEIVERTLNWTLDFGLIEGDMSHVPESLTVRLCKYDELTLVVAPGHPWSRREAVLPADMGDQQLLLREQGSGLREIVEQGLQQCGVFVQPLFTLPDNEAIKQMVMSGVGAAVLSVLSVRRELAQGDLVRIPVAGLDLRAQVGLVQRVDKHLSRAAEAFCSFIYSEIHSGL
jgi:DNA-binding transcriptional LysR family regulator